MKIKMNKKHGSLLSFLNNRGAFTQDSLLQKDLKPPHFLAFIILSNEQFNYEAQIFENSRVGPEVEIHLIYNL